MICLICRQAEIQNGVTSVELQRGEINLIISNVPARVCPNCGEAFVSADVAARLLQHAQNVIHAGVLDACLEYSTA
jgi:YgiT-type zinc finger domain-containing protein